jgi:hypothetical protein
LQRIAVSGGEKSRIWKVKTALTLLIALAGGAYLAAVS